jgi:hypothetical protein
MQRFEDQHGGSVNKAKNRKLQIPHRHSGGRPPVNAHNHSIKMARSQSFFRELLTSRAAAVTAAGRGARWG